MIQLLCHTARRLVRGARLLQYRPFGHKSIWTSHALIERRAAQQLSGRVAAAYGVHSLRAARDRFQFTSRRDDVLEISAGSAGGRRPKAFSEEIGDTSSLFAGELLMTD